MCGNKVYPLSSYYYDKINFGCCMDVMKNAFWHIAVLELNVGFMLSIY